MAAIAQPTTTDLFRQVSAWTPGEAPRPISFDESGDTSQIRWFDIGRNTTPTELLETLGPVCDGLTSEMAEDLLTPDDEPEGRRYGDGRIRLASSFDVVARSQSTTERGQAGGAGVLVIRPVELLANENWVITCWHPARVFHGARRLQPDEPGAPPADLFARVAKRWPCGPAQNSGDLGVLILHELAFSYAPAHRALSSWLEDWELGLYTSDEPDLETLPQLWGSMAVLRDWLNPLNRAGLRADLDRAWLAATDHDAVIAVDDRVDRALETLSELAATMRSSFNLLHVQQVREEREQSDRMQHRIEVMAAAFLIPTLIVGFYGANTWLPGEQAHWGFWVMLTVLLVCSLGGAAIVHRWHKQQKKEADKLKADRRRLHEQLTRRSATEPSTA